MHLLLEDWLANHHYSYSAWINSKGYPRIRLNRALEKVRARSQIIQAALRYRREPFSKVELYTLFGSVAAVDCFIEKLDFPKPEICKNPHNGPRYAYSAEHLRKWCKKHIFLQTDN